KENNEEVTQDDINLTSLECQVFNSEYIKENLKWDTDEELNGIAFDVGENVKIREQITDNNDKIELINAKIEHYKPVVNEFKQFENIHFSREAKRIKNDIFNSLIEFTKAHFKKTMLQFNRRIEGYIISDESELEKIKAISTAVNNKSTINKIDFTAGIESLSIKVNELLEFEPEKSDIINALEKDNELYEWAKRGCDLHQQKELEECSFCGNIIKSTRLQELNNYFSNASGTLREEITKCRLDISDEVQSFSEIDIPKSKNDFIDNCQEEFQVLVNSLETIKEKYKKSLEMLSEELDRKENGNIFNSIKPTICNYSIKNEIEEWISAVNNLIETHNDFVKNFKEEQLSARETLKEHFVATFLNNTGYYQKERDNDRSMRRIRRYDCLINKIGLKNSELEAKLKDVVAGKNELNKYISLFLSNDDINIEVTTNDKFVLKRKDKIAENLSEGEKTAISFSYFLVSLESLKKDQKLKDTIVFIDDPISSLDGNHIAQVYSLIDSFFFRQNENPDNPDEYVNCFKQLFISTHNFEFFSLLKESKRINKKGKREFYLVKRLDTENSCIQSMPKSLRNHKSEYIYLFNIIYDYYKNGCQENDENLILLPNAVRRFLEIYTLIKLPGS